jgi:hypothetical protein
MALAADVVEKLILERLDDRRPHRGAQLGLTAQRRRLEAEQGSF